jgi:hypothetical protein
MWRSCEGAAFPHARRAAPDYGSGMKANQVGVRATAALVIASAVALGACGASTVQPAPAPTRAPPPSSASAHVAEEGVVWSLPAGWKREVIPFPLEFALELAYRGKEVLRFAPRFFDAASPTYFSYAFAWVLDGAPPLDAPTLEADLARYFAGLCREVGGKKFQFDAARFRAHLAPSEARRAGARALHGTVDTYDPFGDGRPLTLHVEVEIVDCPGGGPRVALFAASPADAGAPVWNELNSRVADLRCR